MKILVLGAYGMLGHKLVQVLGGTFDVVATCRQARASGPRLAPDHLITNVTAEDFDSVVRAFAAVRPDVVINCIGIIKQQSAAKDPIPSLSINSLFPHRLAALCRVGGIRLIHFSTDCVFSGSKGMYKEEDVSDATDLYGRSKFLGEVGGEGCLTIRSSIIGRELGTQLGLVEWFLSQAGNRIKGYRKAIYTGLTTLEMANLVSQLIQNQPQLSGVWQVASTPISKFDLLSMLNEMLNLGVQIEPDDQFFCDRSLDGSRFKQATGYEAPSWKQMLSAMTADVPLTTK
jgi:dTDP-4-dehydrorhamnose reductase